MAIRKFLFFTNKGADYSQEVGQASEGLWASKIDKDCTVAPPPQNTNGDISSGLGVTKNGQMWHACQRFSLCIKDPSVGSGGISRLGNLLVLVLP